MNPFTLAAMSAEPFRLWTTFLWKTGEMMLASGQVIGYRTNPNLAVRGLSSSRNRRELALMGSEKVAAATESSQAMATSWMRLNQELGAMAVRQMFAGCTAMMSIAASRTPQQAADRQSRFAQDTLNRSAVAAAQLSGSAARGAQRTLKPIHSRATGNARRLAKR
ncbi:MAG: polyhydroxyalkanoate granule-associated phasin [Betaproteobacteria bacterium]